MPDTTKKSAAPRTMFAKLWDSHVVAELADDTALLHVDRHILHDLGGSRALLDVKERGLAVHDPELTFATIDHTISSAPGRIGTIARGIELMKALREETAAAGIRLFDVDQPGQGIVHVMGPELGISLPGSLLVCGDSHTCTHGGIGALAFGVGWTELAHVIATQTLYQRRPRTMRVRFEGTAGAGRHAQGPDPRLDRHRRDGRRHRLRRRIWRQRHSRHVGRRPADGLQPLGRARRQDGLIAPDEKTFAYLEGRPYAPKGTLWLRAVEAWLRLPSDPGAAYDREVVIDVGRIAPQITWGTSPEHVISVDGRIPDPAAHRRRGSSQGGGSARSTTWDCKPAPPSPARRSIGSSSAPAPTAACPTCRPPPRWCAAARSIRACAPGSCRARRSSSATRRPRGSTGSSSRRASNGASPAAPCASPRTASRCRPDSARSRPPIAISSAARARARAPIWRVRRWRRRRPSPAPSSMSRSLEDAP